MTRFNYGGQAVIEGVMMRGRKAFAVAVRAPDGKVVLHSEPLTNPLYIGGACANLFGERFRRRGRAAPG